MLEGQMTEELWAGDAIIDANQRGEQEIASSEVRTWRNRKAMTHTFVVIRNKFTDSTVARFQPFSSQSTVGPW